MVDVIHLRMTGDITGMYVSRHANHVVQNHHWRLRVALSLVALDVVDALQMIIAAAGLAFVVNSLLISKRASRMQTG